MRLRIAAGLAALALGVCVVSGCSSAPTGPDTTSAAAGAVVIEILGQDGNRSFSPNPASVPAGRTIVWHNANFETHHVVLNDGALDTGKIGPGRFSAPMPVTAAAGYHCLIHPSMVGRLASDR